MTALRSAVERSNCTQRRSGLADNPSMRAPLLILPALACLPGPPDLDGEPPPLDLGVAHETWSEDDLPPWDEPDGPSGGDDSPESDGGSESGGDDTPPAMADPGLSTLRITEVLPDPEGKDGGPDGPELIELLNPTASPVMLDGLIIESRSWPKLDAQALGLSGRELGATQRLVVERYAVAGDVPPGLPKLEQGALRTAFSSGSGLRNGDGAVLVRGAMGEIADLMVYGEPQPEPFDEPGAWQGAVPEAPDSGESLCRPAPESDSDTADDWSACAPSPGAAYDPGPVLPATGLVVITEVYANPPGPSNEEKLLEFVEVRNADADAIDLADFTIADDTAQDAPGIDPVEHLAGDGGCQPATCLAPGRRALIVGNAYQGPAGGALVLATDDTTIADGGLSSTEPVVLRDGLGEIVSTYRDWLDQKAEPDPSSEEQAVHRLGDGADDVPENWELGPASPGD